jgi:hypothetical protein
VSLAQITTEQKHGVLQFPLGARPYVQCRRHSPCHMPYPGHTRHTPYAHTLTRTRNREGRL